MSASDLQCYACGGPLRAEDNKAATCAHPTCPGKGFFYRCGFCGQFSFAAAEELRCCFNRDCRMYQVRRDDCPTCGLPAYCTIGGVEVCLNRRCPANAPIVQECFFCQQRAARQGVKFDWKSFLARDDLNFCTKGDCDHLLERVDRCEVCGKLSLVQKSGSCENSACAAYRQKTEKCASCGLSAVVARRCLQCGAETRPLPPQRGELPSRLRLSKGDLAGQSPPGAPPAKVEAGPGTLGPGIISPLDAPTPKAPLKPGPPLELRARETPAKSQSLGFPTPKRSPLIAPKAPVPPAPAPAPPEKSPPVPQFTLPLGATPLGKGALAPALPPAAILRVAGPLPLTPAPAPPPAGEPPEPPPTARHPVVHAPWASLTPVTRESGSLLEAFEFIKNYILVEDDKQFPIYLVIGLAGAGKTVYLTMLGDILAKGKGNYYFPYEGISAKLVRVDEIIQQRAGPASPRFTPEMRENLKRRIKDLVWDFAKEQYTNYLGKMQWPPATGLEAEDGEIRTHFLVTEITRYNKTIAKIVTIETSGEDFQEVIRTIREFDPIAVAQSPLQRVLHEMFDLAEGFVILISPEHPDNDQVFQNLFLMIQTELEPRALNAYYTQLKAGLMALGEAGEKAVAGSGALVAHVQRLRQEKQLQQLLEAQRQEEAHRLAGLLEQLEQRLGAASDLEALDAQTTEFLRSFEPELLEIDPRIAQVRKIVESDPSPPNLLRFFHGLAFNARLHLEEIVQRRQYKEAAGIRVADIPKALLDKMILDLKERCCLPDGFRIELEDELRDDRPTRRMKKLKHIALVTTKSDTYPIIYPPEIYPTMKLRRAQRFLATIENYLKLLGGAVRYYNASATGYSLMRDVRYYPGNPNTLTPINILEPIFDMLDIPERPAAL